jgi:hypothetical protein
MSYSEGELVQPWRSRAPQREWEFNESEFELIPFGQGEWEGEQNPQPPPVPVPAPVLDIPAAVAANQVLARRIGFACVLGGRLITDPNHPGGFNLPLPGLPRRGTPLPGGVPPSEPDIVRAIAAWQRLNRLPVDGRIGPETWRRMQNDPTLGIPRPTYAPFSMTVSHGGRTLGVIDKVAPYRDCFRTLTVSPHLVMGPCNRTRTPTDTHGGSEIRMGFRVTDMDAVRRAGFVDPGTGEPQFRWVQCMVMRAPNVLPTTSRLRRFNQVLDPTNILLPLDLHPYYHYEVFVGGAATADIVNGLRIGNSLRRRSPDRSSNGLCYDVLFTDLPAVPLSSATMRQRTYFNFETALVGVRGNILAGTQKRNVVLRTFRWGYDVVVNGSQVEVRMNALSAGPVGGSDTFRQVVSREVNGGMYPNHCFVGAFDGGARC